MIDLIEKLIADGSLHQLMKSGLMSPKVLFYRNVFNDFNENLKKRSKDDDKIMQATSDTAENFKITTQTVYNIRKAMSR